MKLPRALLDKIRQMPATPIDEQAKINKRYHLSDHIRFAPISRDEPSIRTTNWNNFNKVKKCKPLPETREQKKFKIVEKIRKRYDLWHNGVVVRSARRFGKTTFMHTIFTEAFSLSQLAHAVLLNDRTKIKNAIDMRINMRGKRK